VRAFFYYLNIGHPKGSAATTNFLFLHAAAAVAFAASLQIRPSPHSRTNERKQDNFNAVNRAYDCVTKPAYPTTSCQSGYLTAVETPR
jgi:hypothetical protein